MNYSLRKTSGQNEKKGEMRLNYETSDTISCVKFSPYSSQFLIVSSWDGTITLLDAKTNTVRNRHNNGRPVLDVCFKDAGRCFSGDLDTAVKSYDLNSGSEYILGLHEKPVKAVEYSNVFNFLLSGSWDSQVKLWDPRMRTNIISLPQPDKVYTLSLCGDKFLVGTAGRQVYVWDLRNLGYVLQRRESSLKYQTRCIKSFPDNKGYVQSSIEGRVAFEYLDPQPEIQKKKFAFKCHRVREDGIEKIYPVNSISFHSELSTFATGGSDGFVNVWDGNNKKRICQFHRYPLAITSICFSMDGSCLAIACSTLFEDDWCDPEVDAQNSVFLRFLSKHETGSK